MYDRNGSADRKRVALAGFGVVGQGVYHRLAAASRRFEVVAVLCRKPERHRYNALPRLLTGDPRALPDYDILIEAIGGVDPAESIVLGAFAAGADVITANKTLVSRRFDRLAEAALQRRRTLLYSAAVGGGVPMLETVDDCAARGPIARLDAVLNGTTNYVLDRIGAGASLDDAIRQAQQAGFAEADPSADIDGVDAAEKISLLARRAFGVAVDPDAIPRGRLASVAAKTIAEAQAAGAPYKQIATARRDGDALNVEVRLRQTSPGEPLSRPAGEENCLIVEMAHGERFETSGKGAGQGPTAASVMSDLETLAAARQAINVD